MIVLIKTSLGEPLGSSLTGVRPSSCNFGPQEAARLWNTRLILTRFLNYTARRCNSATLCIFPSVSGRSGLTKANAKPSPGS